MVNHKPFLLGWADIPYQINWHADSCTCTTIGVFFGHSPTKAKSLFLHNRCVCAELWEGETTFLKLLEGYVDCMQPFEKLNSMWIWFCYGLIMKVTIKCSTKITLKMGAMMYESYPCVACYCRLSHPVVMVWCCAFYYRTNLDLLCMEDRKYAAFCSLNYFLWWFYHSYSHKIICCHLDNNQSTETNKLSSVNPLTV